MFHHKVKTLTDEETQWLKDNFPVTKNSVIAKHLEISESHLHRLAREYGLKKDPDFVRECQKEAAEKAYYINSKKGFRIQSEYTKKQVAAGMVGRRFQKGERLKDKVSPEEYERIMRKKAESWKRTFEEDRKRVRWGLQEPKTKLRIQERNTPRTSAKYRLTKALKYTFIKKWLFAYDSNTTRSALLETRYFEKFRFRFCHISETENI